MRSLMDAMKDAFARVNEEVIGLPKDDHAKWRPKDYVPLGIDTLDRVICCGPGTLSLIAGRPGVGKTSFALHAAITAASEGHPVLVVSPAARDTEIAMRLTCARAKVGADRFVRILLGPKEWGRLTSSASEIGGLPVCIDDSPFITGESLAATADRFSDTSSRERTPLLVFDYVQMLRAHPRRQNRYEELCDASFDLKCLARRLDIAVLTVSQLNRNVDERGGAAYPRLTDLRDSGTLEDDSDAIVFLHQEQDRASSPEAEIGTIVPVNLFVAKNRLGPVGWWRAMLDTSYGSWT